jgi:hypothetical protein
VVEEQAEVFERLKPYLIERWRQQANPRDLGQALSDRV